MLRPMGAGCNGSSTGGARGGSKTQQHKQQKQPAKGCWLLVPAAACWLLLAAVVIVIAVAGGLPHIISKKYTKWLTIISPNQAKSLTEAGENVFAWIHQLLPLGIKLKTNILSGGRQSRCAFNKKRRPSLAQIPST